MTDEDIMQLGGNIELTGFAALAGSEMIVVKKIVGNYVRRFEEMCRSFEALKLRVKPLHQTSDTVKKFELHAQLVDGGNIVTSSVVEHNLFVGIDAVLKKVANELG